MTYRQFSFNPLYSYYRTCGGPRVAVACDRRTRVQSGFTDGTTDNDRFQSRHLRSELPIREQGAWRLSSALPNQLTEFATL
jgi:hypothetical protein